MGDATRSRFIKSGEPFVVVDDVEAPIGLKGPEWIEKEMVYTRKSSSTSPSGSVIEVQSWTFVVPEIPIKTKYLPTGMHYCKLCRQRAQWNGFTSTGCVHHSV